jgi:uncharacterized surface protein with fasciclin (FAS1) repeats
VETLMRPLGQRHLKASSALAILFAASVAACGDDDSKPATGSTIAAIVQENGDFDTLEAALVAADLVATFEGDGPFTVFAPTDEAFAALPAGALDALLADKEALTDVLTYHVVSGRVTAAQVVTLESATTLQGTDIAISVVDGKVVLNGSVNVTVTDIAAKNGVIHKIDAVLIPEEPQPTTNTIADIVATNPDFTTLKTAVAAAGLGTTLAGTGPFTVFAPTNAAFAALPAGALDALLADTQALTDVLLYHAIPGAEVNAATVVTLPRATAANGVDIKITVTNGEVFLNDTVKVSVTDVEADNGIIHIIDAVLLPPPTIAGLLDGPDFALLKTAVAAAELTATLDGDTAYTVFAPTSAAIQAIGSAEQLQALLADKPRLTDLLLHHVVAGKKYASDVTTAQSFAMANGLTLPITAGATVKIGDATITRVDVYARNGVVHVIDAVLVPPPTIAQVVATNPDFETLLAAVSAAELVATLNGPGPFTVFAPTDAAFEKIAAAGLAAILADKDLLTDILLYHVIDGEQLAAAVVAKNHLTMKNGAIVPITTTGGAKIGGALITTTDLKVRNGVIHIIDTVIVPPPTIAEIVTENGDFSTLLAAVGAAELAMTLDEGGPFTVFAPNNAAFAKVDAAALTALLADKDGLTDVLLYHVFGGVVPASVAVTLDNATMANGDVLDFTYDAGAMTLTVGGSLVIATDIWARNGVIHAIDTVLFPPE